MKKLIAILFLFVFSLFVANSQSKVMFVDSLKTVTVNVSTDDVKQQVTTTDNLQLQLAKSVDSQTTVNQSLSESIIQFTSAVNGYTQAVEEKNKSDSQPFLDKFNYSLQDVKKSLRKERWLNFTIAFTILFYMIYAYRQLFNRRDSADNLLIKALIYIITGVSVYFVLKWFLTLLFNPTYFFIKELIALYT
jgi:hypothetical protein